MGRFIKRSLEGEQGPILGSKQRPISPIISLIRLNPDTNGLEYYNGSAYVELAKVGSTELKIDTFTGDATTTAFVMLQSVANASDILVFIGGVFQAATTNYTVSGVNITFTSAPPMNQTITIIHNIGTNYVTDANIYDVPNL